MDFSSEIMNFMTEQVGGIVIVEKSSGNIMYADSFFEKEYKKDIVGACADDVLKWMKNCPVLTSEDDMVEWEGIDYISKQYYKLNSCCIKKQGQEFYIHQLVDITEYIGLNRDITKYMAFFKKLSKFQTAILENLSNTYYEMLPLVADYFKAEQAYFFLEREQNIDVVTYEKDTKAYSQQRIKLNDAAATIFSLELQEKLYTESVCEDLQAVFCSDSKERIGNVSENSYCFLYGGNVSGQRYAIYLEVTSKSDTEFMKDKTLLSVIRLCAENGIMREKLIYDSEHDGLTGLFNKGKYLSMAEEVYPFKDNVAIFNFDVNNLKKINDTLGHEAGDKLIIKAADSIRKVTGINIHGYRMGGDEFLMAAYDISEEEALCIKEKWEEELARLNMADDGIHCVVALGLACGGGSEWEALCKRADELMYEDKKKKKKPGEEIR